VAQLKQVAEPTQVQVEESTQKRKVWVPISTKKQAIVLLHGLNRIAYDFEEMQKKLKKDFLEATIVALESMNKTVCKNKKIDFSAPSVKLPIIEQAALAYKEIIQKVAPDAEVVLIGHSQGGLRGFSIAKEYFETLRKRHNIVIKKLITIGTPWQGAPVMERIHKQTETRKDIKDVKNTLDKISDSFAQDITHYLLRVPQSIDSFVANFPFLYNYLGQKIIYFTLHGIADLQQNSNFITQYVAKGIETFKIPITAIAGVLTDFSKLFDPFPTNISANELKTLNEMYATLIGGSKTCEHDMLLPVDTQHAIGLKPLDFERIKVYGTCHGNKVGKTVKKEIAELNHEEVTNKVITILRETFYQEIEEETICAQTMQLEVPLAA